MRVSFGFNGLPVTVDYLEGSGKVDISSVEHCGGIINQFFEEMGLWDELEEALEEELSKGEENEETDFYKLDAADWSLGILN